MRSIPPRHASKVTAVAAALLSLLCAALFYRHWILHLGIPIDLSGDAVQKLQLATAAVRHGWILHNPSIGLPGQGQHLDFPRYDSLNYALIKGVAWFTGGDAIVAANVYFLLGYPLVALAGYWVLRKLGLSLLWSFVGGVAYAWFPYHQLRGFQQFTNAAYVLVPVAFLFFRSVWYPAANAAAWSRREWAAWLAFGVMLELQNPYYAVFFSVLALSLVLVLGALRGFGSSRVACIRTAVLVAAIILTFSLEQMPRWIFEAQHGKNALAVVRPPSGVSEFALSLVDLVNPSPDHPLPWLANWTQSAAAIRGIKYNERVVATLPLIGLIGLVVASVALLRRNRQLEAGDDRARIQQWAGGLIVLCLAWCHEGALCTLISETGFGLVRGWNRMSIFIGFATVLASVSWFEGLSSGWTARRRNALGVVVLLLVLAEQLFATSRNSFVITAARLNEAKQLSDQLTADGKFHRAFIVPYLEYPEAGKSGQIQDYDHFMLPIASAQLAVSYGSMRGRGSHYFSSATADLHGVELSSYLRDAGFDTLIVDTFSATTTALQKEVATALGSPVARTQRFLAYRIGIPSRGDPQESSWRAYRLGTVLSFRDVASRRYLELNFSSFEADGTWTLGPLAAVRLHTSALPGSLRLDIEGELFEDPKKAQRVRVLFDGRSVCELDRVKSGRGTGHQWSCRIAPDAATRAAQTHEIRFEIEHPVSPAMLRQSADARLLGLRLVSLQLDAAGDGSDG